MKQLKLPPLVLRWPAIAVAIGVALAAAARAGEPPRDRSGQTLELVSAVSQPLPAVAPLPQWSPSAPHATPAIDCVDQCPPGYTATWNALGPVDIFEQWAQGEYVGRSRLPHVPAYRLRVDDQMEFLYRVDHNRVDGSYKLEVGDTVLVESVADPDLGRTLIVLPDGTVTLPMLGQVEAANKSALELRDSLEEKFKAFYNEPAISVTPVSINTKLEELRATVAGEVGFAQQIYLARVTPEGTVQVPAVGSLVAQGLTLEELELELNERYAEEVQGMHVVPVLRQHGPRYVYVLGEVRFPGRYSLDAPTTVMQAIARAGSWTVGAHLTNVVIFRRVDDWRLMATVLDLRAAFAGNRPCPDGELWVGDTDLIIVPKAKIERFDNFVQLVFTRGVYGVLPVGSAVNYAAFRGLLPFLPIPPIAPVP